MHQKSGSIDPSPKNQQSPVTHNLQTTKVEIYWTTPSKIPLFPTPMLRESVGARECKEPTLIWGQGVPKQRLRAVQYTFFLGCLIIVKNFRTEVPYPGEDASRKRKTWSPLLHAASFPSMWGRKSRGLGSSASVFAGIQNGGRENVKKPG